MKNGEYWRGRFSILEDTAFKQSERSIQAIEQMYLEAERSVRKEIEAWYGRFAGNNQLSLAEARKLLGTKQLEEFRWTVKQYIQAGKKAGTDPAWLKRLENASAKVHVSRLEAVQTEIQQQLELLYGNQVDEIDSLLKKVAGDGYTHTAFEVQKGIGLGWDMTALNQKKLEALLAKPWTTDGRTFRDRCWVNKAGLADSIHKNLIQGMLRGDSPEKAVRAIQKQFEVSRYQARRLVHTETSYFNAQAAKEAYKDLDIERIEILGTLDGRTCPLCGGMDGKVITLAQYEPGVTVPPWHPNCRCTTCPYYDDLEGERAARNAEGEVYYVPQDMTFEQWKKAFVDGNKSGLTEVIDHDKIPLTDKELWALNEYISSGSYKINPLLRESMELSTVQKEMVEYLDSALEKMPLFEGTVYRSMTDFDIQDIDAFLAAYVPGKVIPFPAYTSSGTKVYDESFPIQYVIQSHSGRDIRAFNPNEYEILFPRDTSFRVVRVEGHTIFMEEV